MASGDIEYELTNLANREFNVEEVTTGSGPSYNSLVTFELYGPSSVGTYDGATLSQVVASISYTAQGTSTDRKGGVNPFDPDKRYKITITEV
jgi:hypothetical protein